MINQKGIFIKNIYYMLAYAYDFIDFNAYSNVAYEKFENTYDLLAVLLVNGFTTQLKKGIYKTYENNSDSFSTQKGKININETLQLKSKGALLLHCEYDEFTENNIYNQIIKATFIELRNLVEEKNKRRINNLLRYLISVDNINLKKIDLLKLSFNKLNRNYKILINLCYFFRCDYLLVPEQGEYLIGEYYQSANYNKLFEKFVLKYYQKHYPQVFCSAKKMNWNFSGINSEYLPILKTDITITNKNNDTLIIDTKFYENILKENNYGKKVFRSSHIQQIYSYMKLYEESYPCNSIHGCLLYAKTSETLIPDFKDENNRIVITYLDLNQEFDIIKNSLDQLINIISIK